MTFEVDVAQIIVPGTESESMTFTVVSGLPHGIKNIKRATMTVQLEHDVPDTTPQTTTARVPMLYRDSYSGRLFDDEGTEFKM